REMSEGPVTHLTMLITPKSRTKVRISSSALSWASGATRSASVGAPRDSSIVAPSHHGPWCRHTRHPPISYEVVLHDIHDCFIGVAVRPIAIALVLCVSNALFGVTYCTARGGTFEKSEPSPSAIVG